jgi:putative lipoprotein
MRLIPLILTAPFFLLACSTPPPQIVAPVIVEEIPASIVKQPFAKILDANFRGQFSLGEGKGFFKACDANKEFAVDPNFILRNIYEQVSPIPFTPVYIEFTGEITFPSVESGSSEATMRVDRVHHMALAKASLQCDKPIDTFLFKANGDNPYWRLNIDNQELYFSTKASNKAYEVDEADFRTTQINNITTTNKEGQQLKLKIQPGHCYDLKNKAYWGYTTQVNSIWGEYSGCGEPGWPIEEQLFTGYYLNNQNDVTTNLTLNPNYTVEYKETVSGEETIKTGFWKTNSPDNVVIMLSQQAGDPLRQEFIFKRTGLTLNAKEMNNNNISTIFETPFVFNKMNAYATVEEEKISRIDRKFNAQQIGATTELDLDIQKAVYDYFKIHRTDPKDTQFNAVKYDLNGDGIDEAIVMLDWCSIKNGCEMLIFEGQTEGYRFSSRISRVHAPIVISYSQHYLWQSLLIEKDNNWLSLDFDGLSYPNNTKNAQIINKDDVSTDVVIFNNGKPKQWFPIKM